MASPKITEADSAYQQLEKMSVSEILSCMNKEDKTVAFAVEKALPQIEKLITAIVDRVDAGGRLFYLGAGTSGRLGILDASECPPSFGVPEGLVMGIIAGGEKALTRAVENAEDDINQGWLDLQENQISIKDMVVGITAGGATPYVLGALQKCREMGIASGSISSDPEAPINQISNFPVVVVVGPEFVTASSRLKSGTAQKMILNMISTAVMIQLGRVADNKMVNMQLTNEKLLDRGARILMEKTGETDYQRARELVTKSGSIKMAIENYHS